MAQAVYVTMARTLRSARYGVRADGELRQRLRRLDRPDDGHPIADFVVASNANDILTRFVNDGDMSTPVVPTLSPSMDIQVSSNFERLLFEMNGRDGGRTAEQLARFRQSGRLGSPAESDGGGSAARSGRPLRRRRERSPRSAESMPPPGC